MNHSRIIRCTREQLNDMTPNIGDLVFVKNNDNNEQGCLQIWTGTEWNAVKVDTASEITMSAYDMNKQLIHQLPVLNETELMNKWSVITDFCNQTNNNYYMLLCRDKNYYTLMHRVRNGNSDIDIATLVIECANTLGELKSIELANGAIEIWADGFTDEDSTVVMYFFPYDGGVEECL